LEKRKKAKRLGRKKGKTFPNGGGSGTQGRRTWW